MAFNMASVAKTDNALPPILCIYGDGGIGKTTLAANAPAPIFIQCEAGQGVMELDAFPMVTKYQQLIEALNSVLAEAHDFKTLVIDSLDHLEQRVIWPEVCERGDEKGSRQNIEGFGFGKGYKLAISLWHEVMDLLHQIRTQKKMAIILIAHCKVKRYDSPITDSYDRYMIKLHDSASEYIRESCDAVLFAFEETVVNKTESGFGKSKNRGIGTGRRILGCVDTAAYQAKNRFNMPTKINLDWPSLMNSVSKV